MIVAVGLTLGLDLCIPHHRSWYFTQSALILVWHSRICSQLV